MMHNEYSIKDPESKAPRKLLVPKWMHDIPKELRVGLVAASHPYPSYSSSYDPWTF